MINSADFPETNHCLIQPLLQLDDLTLVELLQSQPTKGKYLVTIFCRYHQAIIDLLTDFYSREDVVIISWEIWKKITQFLFNFNVDNLSPESSALHVLLLDYTIDNLRTGELNMINSYLVNFDLRFFPLFFYTDKALYLLSKKERLVLVLKDKFEWENKQIISYFQGTGEILNHEDINSLYQSAHHHLTENLPMDIRSIYLENKGKSENQNGFV